MQSCNTAKQLNSMFVRVSISHLLMMTVALEDLTIVDHAASQRVHHAVKISVAASAASRMIRIIVERVDESSVSANAFLHCHVAVTKR